MRYSIDTLIGDVMARLGEVPRPQASHPAAGSDGIPWPEDVIAMKVRSLLPEVGSRLIMEAPRLPNLTTQQPTNLTTQQPTNLTTQQPTNLTTHRLPCGLYAAEVPLPEDFLRLGSVKMGEWRHAVSEVVDPKDPEWSRQWSSEPGIAGCPERPRAYLDSSADGPLLRLACSRSADDFLEWLGVWRVPAPDADGCFDFPSILYPELIRSLTLP